MLKRDMIYILLLVIIILLQFMILNELVVWNQQWTDAISSIARQIDILNSKMSMLITEP